MDTHAMPTAPHRGRSFVVSQTRQSDCSPRPPGERRGSPRQQQPRLPLSERGRSWTRASLPTDVKTVMVRPGKAGGSRRRRDENGATSARSRRSLGSWRSVADVGLDGLEDVGDVEVDSDTESMCGKWAGAAGCAASTASSQTADGDSPTDAAKLRAQVKAQAAALKAAAADAEELKRLQAALPSARRREDRLKAQISKLEQDLTAALINAKSTAAAAAGLKRAEERHKAVSNSSNDRWEAAAGEAARLTAALRDRDAVIADLEGRLVDAQGAASEVDRLQRRVAALQSRRGEDGGGRGRVAELEARVREQGVLLRNTGLGAMDKELQGARGAVARAEEAREAAIEELRVVREAWNKEVAEQRAHWEAKYAALKDKAYKLAEVEVKTHIVELEAEVEEGRAQFVVHREELEAARAEVEAARATQKALQAKVVAGNKALSKKAASVEAGKKREKELKAAAGRFKQRALDAEGTAKAAGEVAAAVQADAGRLRGELAAAVAAVEGAREEARASVEGVRRDLEAALARAAGAAERAKAAEEGRRAAEEGARELEGKLRAAEDKLRAAEDKAKEAEDMAKKAEDKAKEAEDKAAAGEASSHEVATLQDAVKARDVRIADLKRSYQSLHKQQGAALAAAAKDADALRAKVTGLEADKAAAAARCVKLTHDRDGLRSKLKAAEDAVAAAKQDAAVAKQDAAVAAAKLTTARSTANAQVDAALEAAMARARADADAAHAVHEAALAKVKAEAKAARKADKKTVGDTGALRRRLAEAEAATQAARAETGAARQQVAAARRQAVDEYHRLQQGLVADLEAVADEEAKCRDAVGNLNCLIKEAKMTEMKKEADALKNELKGANDALSVLTMSVTAAEEKMAATDPHTADKSLQAREEQLRAIRKRTKASRDASNSFQSASVVNVTHLQDVLPRNKRRVADAAAARADLLAKLKAEPGAL